MAMVMKYYMYMIVMEMGNPIIFRLRHITQMVNSIEVDTDGDGSINTGDYYTYDGNGNLTSETADTDGIGQISRGYILDIRCQ